MLVIERRGPDSPRPGSRAAYLHGLTLRHFEAISPGLGRRVADAGIMWHTKRTLWRGRDIYCQTYPTPDPEDLPPFTSLPQTRTEDIMLEACIAAGVEFEWDCNIVNITSDTSGVLATDSRGYRWEADYVLGADGARSAVRSAIGVSLEGPRTNHEFVVVDLAHTPEADTPTERVFHYQNPRLGGRNTLAVPFAGGWRVDLSLNSDDDASTFTTPEGLSDWIPKVMSREYVDRVTWVSTYRFAQQTATALTDTHRRVLLCGEAAHLFAPFGARGMNSSVPDSISAVSAVELALEHGPRTPRAHAAIELFERERLDAARYNRACADLALQHMTGASRAIRVKQRIAASVAIWGRKTGKWLDSAPYGPPLAARRGKAAAY